MKIILTAGLSHNTILHAWMCSLELHSVLLCCFTVIRTIVELFLLSFRSVKESKAFTRRCNSQVIFIRFKEHLWDKNTH